VLAEAFHLNAASRRNIAARTIGTQDFKFALLGGVNSGAPNRLIGRIVKVFGPPSFEVRD
jgi:hypothetical protein